MCPVLFGVQQQQRSGQTVTYLFAQGRTVDFNNMLIIMTTNVGSSGVVE